MFTHPDYDPDQMLIYEMLANPRALDSLVRLLLIELDNESSMENPNETLKQWLGTFEVDGKSAQLQLVLTAKDSLFVDEGYTVCAE